jgi:hypothetical protein
MYARKCIPSYVCHQTTAMDAFHLIVSNGVFEYIVHSRQDAIILTEIDTICRYIIRLQYARPSFVDVVRTVGLAVGRLLSTNAEEGKGP